MIAQEVHTVYSPDKEKVKAEMMLVKNIKSELVRCLQSSENEQDPLKALQEFTVYVIGLQQPLISKESIADLDKDFLDLALDTLADDKATPLEKAAGVSLSLHFGAKQRGVDKTQMLLEERLATEQAASLRHIGKSGQRDAHSRLAAIEEYFEFGGLEYHTVAVDSKMSLATKNAAASAKNQFEKGQVAVTTNGVRVSRKAASVALIASIGVFGGATVAAAESGTPTSQGGQTTLGAEAAFVAQSVINEGMQENLEVPMVASVETVTPSTTVTPIESPRVVTVPMVPSVEAIAPATEPTPVTLVPNPEVSQKVAVQASVSPEVETLPSTPEDATPIAHTPLAPQAPTPERVKVTPMVEELPVVDKQAEKPEPVVIALPNSDVNVAPNETPKEALNRIVASRDMGSASYAARMYYGGKELAKQEPVNPTLSTKIASEVASLRSQISSAAHADAAYSDKAFYALTYLDAVTQAPTLLDNPEVAAFVASIIDQGEDYRNKLFATYLAQAGTDLADEKAGAYNGIGEQYRGSIETLYAFSTMAGKSDAQQVEQIEAIKAEEVRITAEEEAKRVAEEQIQQGVSEIEIIASDEKRLVLTAIERALQRELITKKFADVYRLVIEQEGPDALVPAAGMIGNCMAEADGCNPVVVERGNGIGFGIFQWSFERRTKLESTAKAKGVDVGGVDYQVAYAIDESKGRTQRNDRSKNEWEGMMAQKDPAAAVEFWRWNFERPKEELSHTDVRVKAGVEVFNTVNGQINTIREEAATAKAAREAEIERQKQERLEQERQKQEAQEAGDMRSVLADGLAIMAELKKKYNNVSGKLDSSELVEVDTLFKNGKPYTMQLNPAAAVGFGYMAEAFKAEFGYDIRVTDDYRDYTAQVRVKEEKPDLAITAGQSLHGWGLALDLAVSINIEGSAEHKWMEKNAHKFGWVNPGWAHDGKGKEEPWHWEFDGSKATFKKSN